jgi:poly [ADP-ribose] polymerase
MVQSSFFDGKMALWSHYHCFFKRSHPISTSEIQGFDRLRWDDQQKIRQNIGGGSGSSSKTTGMAARGGLDEPDSGTGMKRKGKLPKGAVKKVKLNDSEKEAALREQSEFVWKIRDQLQENVTIAGLKELMEWNGQRCHRGGESTLLAYVSDGMAFGALEPCPECKGQLRFLNDTEGYSCTGNITEWTKCLYSTKDPKRKPWVIPDEMDDIAFLKSFKFKPRKRLFSSDDDASPPQPMVVGSSSMDEKPAPKVKGSGKPLDDFKVATIGRLSQTKAQLTEEIEANGGSVVDKIRSDLTVCISNEAEVKKLGKRMQDAKKANIPIVSLDFLEDAVKGAAQLKIPTYSIATWGLKKSTGTDIVDGPKNSAMQGMSGHFETKKVKMTVKGGAAVESDSGLEGRCHVLEYGGSLYSATLGMVDITRGTNSFYKLQVLESDKGKRYYLFRSWGRVGTTIGGNKVEPMRRDECIDRFEQLYAEKSGNCWSDRKKFVKRPGKFFPIELDYGEEDEKVKTAVAPGSSSKLPVPVQNLIKMIFDVEAMKKALVEFEIDLKKMPLGKLSKRQIKSAFEVLTELQKTVQRDPTSSRILDFSNRFFTLIPHDFGLARPPLLNTEEVIKVHDGN